MILIGSYERINPTEYSVGSMVRPDQLQLTLHAEL